MPSDPRTSSRSASCRGCTRVRPSRPRSGFGKKFAKNEAGRRSQQGCVPCAGFNFGETTEAVGHRFEVRPAKRCPPVRVHAQSPATRRCRGDSSPPASWPTCRLTLGSYPITPASDILHELSKHKHFGIRTVQAEDEIAAVGVALGACVRRPPRQSPPPAGPAWPSRARRSRWPFAIELPMLIIDIQRGGPSTGLPTKTEASDLNLALYGRHGEAPLPVVASYSPAHCFHAAIEAARIALKYRTPVMSAQRRLPRQRVRALEAARPVASLPDISVPFADGAKPRRRTDGDRRRSGRTCATPRTLARPWAIPWHAWSHAPRRRARERPTAPATSTTPPRTTNTWTELQRREGRCGSLPTSRSTEVQRRLWTPTCSIARVGLHLGRDRCGRAASPPRRRQGRVKAHLTHLSPLPPDLGDILAPLPQRVVLVPELNRWASSPHLLRSAPTSIDARGSHLRCRVCLSSLARSKHAIDDALVTDLSAS